MSKIKTLVLIFLVFALTAEVAYSIVRICPKLGYFQHFLRRNLNMAGCDDANDRVRLEVSPTGLVLRGLTGNGDIPIKVTSDTRGMATGVNQFGISDHNVALRVVQDEIQLVAMNQGGGSCNAILRGNLYCRYSVTFSTCATVILLGANVCAPCGQPCKDYGNDLVKVFAQGVSGTCNLRLRRTFTNCVGCSAGTGIVIAPVEE